MAARKRRSGDEDGKADRPSPEHGEYEPEAEAELRPQSRVKKRAHGRSCGVWFPIDDDVSTRHMSRGSGGC
jgi:hypothetical protein